MNIEDDNLPQDEDQYWLENCGYIPSEGSCTKVGSEECDWECPYHNDYVLGKRIKDLED